MASSCDGVPTVSVLAGEHRVHVTLERSEVADVDLAERDDDLVRHPDLLQLHDGAQRGEVGLVVRLVTDFGGVGEQADFMQAVDDLSRDAGPFDQFVSRVLTARVRREQTLEAGPVGVEQGSDRREREALGLEVANALDSGEMVGAVELVPARTFGRGEQLLAHVVPDRVDGEA